MSFRADSEKTLQTPLEGFLRLRYEMTWVTYLSAIPKGNHDFLTWVRLSASTSRLSNLLNRVATNDF
jgi:hypothetical protein